MTILEAIVAADKLWQNDYSAEDKLKWLSELDGKVWLDVICTHKPMPLHPFRGYDGTTDIESTELLIPFPFTNVYELYIGMMIDLHNNDLSRYANSLAAFNATYGGFTDWYNRTHQPVGVRALRF